MALESACIPLPSEVTMPFAGYLVATGHLHFWTVVFMGVLGNLIGSLVAYAVGYIGGRPLVLHFGRYVRLSERHLLKAEDWFAHRGQSSVLIGRLLPVVRTFISLPAGVAKMPFGKFVLYTVIGCIPWVVILTWAGTSLSKNWSKVDHIVHSFQDVVIVLIVLAIIVAIWRVVRRGRRR